jgi:hypothetical protein
MSLRRRISPLAVLVVLIVIACGGDESTGDSSFVDSLDWIPSNRDNGSQVFLFNLETLRESAGIPLPDDRTDVDQVDAYEAALIEASRLSDLTLLVLDQDVGDQQTQRNYLDYLHLSLADVDLIAEAGVPPDRTFVAGGRFDADAATETLRECSSCFEPTDKYEHDGVSYLGWGVERRQNLRERLSPPMYDNLGRGGRLFITNEIAIRTPTDALMRATLDAGVLNDRSSLADREDFELAAEALDREGVWFALITTSTLGPRLWEEIGGFLLDYVDDPDEAERLEEQWNPGPDAPVLREHQLFAAGAVSDGQDNYLVVVLVHEDAADAEASVDLLRRRIDELPSATSGEPWRDIITSADIDTNGRVLVARLHGLDLWSFHNQVDPLTLHE